MNLEEPHLGSFQTKKEKTQLFKSQSELLNTVYTRTAQITIKLNCLL